MATYLILGLVVLTLLDIFARRVRKDSRWWAALGVLIILTAIFDNIIVGLGIVEYDPALILGVKLGYAPIEDFFYAIGALLIVPALWQRGGNRE